MMSSPLDAFTTTPRPPPVRKTYGKKRILMDPDVLSAEGIAASAKKSRIMTTPTKGSNRIDSRTKAPLQNNLVNTPTRRLDPPPPLIPAPSSQLASPTKFTRRGVQDQNMLDSPFLEPRKPSPPPGVGPTLRSRRTSSSMKAKPDTRSRHLSLNRSISKNKTRAKETSAETLRRKTSEATTVLGTTLTEHSWLVPPPPRRLIPTHKPSTNPGSSAFDFSFNPPAESTVAHVRRPARSPPGTVEDPLIVGSDDTPTPPRRTLQDEIIATRPQKDTERYRKRHDSILSTDSEDHGTSISIFGLTPKPRPVNVPPEDLDMTPRNPHSLIEQLCGPRSRSGSVTVRPLSKDIPSAPSSNPGEDADDEMGERPASRQDASVRALADACAEMDLGGDSSPSHLIKSVSRRMKGKRKAETSERSPVPPSVSSPAVQRARRSAKPYQLSPRTVHRLSQRRRVGMRIEDHPLSPNDDVDMFASYEFDRGKVVDADN